MRLANPKNFNRKASLALVAAIALTGCQSTPEGTDGGASDAGTSGSSSTFGTGQPGGVDSTDRNGGAMTTSGADANQLSQTVFYFDFDKALIKPAAYASLKAHAQQISANPNLAVRIEGHADERGTREYNVALGERRGNAISKFLRVNGVSGAQLEVVSYGEEKPLSFGHDDSSWSQNRRVEIKY
ncbi:MAG: peptidoglycan-associated lipoprotein Pal [Pseudomonadales bacterium]|nr:peptidoglycan-associated lipoprotein Pal [Pseudomonadales bacterium]PHQ71965.1 MAG: peptidoglycan-associated lipoprotein [Paracoccus sp. (in: a-proteobacteria)]